MRWWIAAPETLHALATSKKGIRAFPASEFAHTKILKGSEYVIDPEKIGYETCAYIGIYLKDPESFDSVTRALEAIPEVVECHFTTGKYDMFIKIYAKNNHHLLSIIHDKLQPLGLARTETLISFHEAIKRQMPNCVSTFETKINAFLQE